MTDPERVLVRLPTWIGDAVMATPALRALRRRFPSARLTAIGKGHLRPLLAGGEGERSAFDHFIALADEMKDTVSEIAAERGDLAIVLPHSFRSALEVARAGVPRRVGYARQGRSALLTDALLPHRRRHPAPLRDRLRVRGLELRKKLSKSSWLRAVERSPELLKLRRDVEEVIPVPMIEQYTELVSVVGAVDDGRGPELQFSPDEKTRAIRHLEGLGLREGDAYIGVNPGASFGSSKVVPPEQLAEAARRTAEALDLRALVLCGPGEEELASDVAAKIGERGIDTSRAMVKLDLLKPVIAGATVLITTDTGPWHIANAVGVKSVSILGPTDPRYTGSRLEGQIVLRRDVVCGPCHEKRCPLDHRCMTAIGAGEIADAAIELARRVD